VWPNYKTKEELKEAIKAGKIVTIFEANPLLPGTPDGTVAIEGPHPEAYRWFAQATLKDGRITNVK